MPDRRLASLVRSEIEYSGRLQREIAADLGITEKHVSRTLRGIDGLSVDLAERMLNAVDRTLVLSTAPLIEQPAEESR